MGNKSDRNALICADIISRPNAMNGKYQAGQFGLDYEYCRKFPVIAQMKADLADKLIAEAALQGRDTTDVDVLIELGRKVQSDTKPIPVVAWLLIIVAALGVFVWLIRAIFF